MAWAPGVREADLRRGALAWGTLSAYPTGAERARGDQVDIRRWRGAGRAAPPSVGILDKGGAGSVPPSAAVRVHRRVRNSPPGEVRFSRLDPAAYVAGGTEPLAVLLVVRDALPAELMDDVLRRADAEGSRVVVDVDDDLVSPEAVSRLAGQGYDPRRLRAFQTLLARADQVTVSTAHLAEVLRAHTGVRTTTVVPNELDPRLWSGEDGAAPALEVASADEVRLLYMGSKTHHDDLELVRDLPRDLGRRLGCPVVLEVVGIAGDPLPDGTRRLVPDRTNYAGFARWLRRNRGRWHAAVAPLVDTGFNLSKSDLKLLEYAALELGTVASPVGPYAAADPVLARTAEGTSAWVDRLEQVVEERRRDGPAVAPAAWVAEHRTMTDRSLSQWRRTLLGSD